MNEEGNLAPQKATIFITTFLALMAFAGNSLLNRYALDVQSMDAIQFSVIRLMAGALFLWAFCAIKHRQNGVLTTTTQIAEPKLEATKNCEAAIKNVDASTPKSDRRAGLALLFYAVPFSLAYIDLSAGTGALILFATVQLTLFIFTLIQKQPVSNYQVTGMLVALAGLILLLSPKLEAPDPIAACLMMVAGFSWGIYTALGKKATAPITATRDNFIIAALLATPLLFVLTGPSLLDTSAKALVAALLSGAITSGLGYVLWYKVLPHLSSLTAGISQLSVPVLTAILGLFFLGETLTATTLISSGIILSGIILSLKK